MQTHFLLDSIDSQVKELKITSLDISFNELADMYNDGELIIQPAYQRTFRWKKDKQSRFIESLLMEMPIPPIYVIERDDGIYELIDGLQRISAYLNFRGELNKVVSTPDEKAVKALLQTKETLTEDDIDEEIDEEVVFEPEYEAFILQGCDIVTELNGYTFDTLPPPLKMRLKRRFIRMEVLRKGINPQRKYHMFKRLNTGGEILEPQEVRNCTIRLIDNKFIDFIVLMSSNHNFLSTISYISQAKISKKFHEELVLRFFAFTNNGDAFKHDLNVFLTEYMEKVSIADVEGTACFDYKKERMRFEQTFKILDEYVGRTVFSAYKMKSDSFSGFNVYQYEAIVAGVQSVLCKLDDGSISKRNFVTKINEVKKSKDFISATVGGGKNSTGLYKQRIQLVKDAMETLNDNT